MPSPREPGPGAGTPDGFSQMRVYFARGENHSLKRCHVATENPQGRYSRPGKDLTRVPWGTVSGGSVNPTVIACD
jgi:hypothetical protein